jgi:hypothetical protein
MALEGSRFVYQADLIWQAIREVAAAAKLEIDEAIFEEVSN